MMEAELARTDDEMLRGAHVQEVLQSAEAGKSSQVYLVAFPSGSRAVIKLSHNTMQREWEMARLVSGLHPADERLSEARLLQGAAVARKTHVIPCLSVCSAGPVSDMAMLVLPFVGYDLARTLHRKPVCTVDMVLRVARDVALGLMHCHEQRVLHGDVKPSNIVLFGPVTGHVVDAGAQCEAALCDFSLSRLAQRRSQQLHGGTPAYMAPEQSGRLADMSVTDRSDLYSLGVVMYEMLAGKLPFSGNLAYAHMALSAPPLPSSLPPAVRAVVAKLLQKDPQDRYSSAYSLQADLSYLLDKQAMAAYEFVPDVAARAHMFLQAPLRLHGVRDAIEQCMAPFNIHDGTVLLLCMGESGTGKSSLMMHVRDIVLQLRAGAILVQGKFDQSARIPCSAIIQCLRELSTLNLPLVRRFETSAFREHVAVLRSMCPDLGLLVSDSAEAPAYAEGARVDEAQLRVAVAGFFDHFAACSSPIVLLLDDLQWADDASCSFLRTVLTESRRAIVVATQRPLTDGGEDEGDAGRHSLRALLATLRKKDIVNQVLLQSLSVDHVARLLLDMMRVPDTGPAGEAAVRAAIPLAEAVHRRTGGNPFFTISFAYDMFGAGKLHFRGGAWRWDVDAIASEGPTENVVQFLVRQMSSLPRATQLVLAAVAWCGFHPSVALLGEALGLDSAAAERHALLLLERGFLSGSRSTMDALVLAHDRVQESAQLLVDAQARVELRLQLGRAMARSLGIVLSDELRTMELPAAATQALVYATIDNLGAACPVALRAVAAHHALSVMAYRKAYELFSSCNLKLDAWPDESYAFLLAFHRDWGLSASLCLDHESATKVFQTCERHVRSDFERAAIMLNRCRVASLQERYEDTLRKGLLALELAGKSDAHIRPDVTVPEAVDFASTRILDRCKAETDGLACVAAFSEDDDAAQVLADGIMGLMIPAAYMTQRIGLWVVLGAAPVASAVERRRFTRYTAASLAALGFMLLAVADKIEDAAALAQAAMRAHARLTPAQAVAADGSYYMHLAFCMPLDDPKESLRHFDLGFDASFRSGNFAFCTYARALSIWVIFMAGATLPDLEAAYASRSAFVRDIKVESMLAFMDGVALYGRMLSGHGGISTKREALALEQRARTFGPLTACSVWVALMAANYALGLYSEAERMLTLMLETRETLFASAGMRPNLEFYFFGALVVAHRMCSGHALPEDAAWLEQWSARLQRIATTSSAGSDWGAKWWLVRGAGLMASRADGARFEAMGALDKAVRMAQALHIRALAYRLLGEASAGAGLDEVRLLAVEREKECWRAYGAAEVVAWIAPGASRSSTPDSSHHVSTAPSDAQESSSSSTSKSPDPTHSSSGGPSTTSGSRRVRHNNARLDSVFEATRVISSEVQLDALCMQFLAICEERSGAQRSVLILRAVVPPSAPDVVLRRVRAHSRSMPVLAASSESVPSANTTTTNNFGAGGSVPNVGRALTRPSALPTSSADASAPVAVPPLTSALSSASLNHLASFEIKAVRADGMTQVLDVPLNETLVPMTLLQRCYSKSKKQASESITVGDALREQGETYYAQNGVRSCMVVPVVVSNEIIGMIYLESRVFAGAFNPLDHDEYRILAAQLGVSVQNARMYTELRQREEALQESKKQVELAHAASERFVPKAFLHRIGRRTTVDVELGDALELELVIMFADVRGFTSLCEQLDAPGVIDFVNRFLAVVVPAVEANGGSVDKFLGDGSLSLFEECGEAVAAARAIQTRIRALVPPVMIGCGLHAGPVICGTLGTQTRLDATVVGDAVNLAARIESLTKIMGARILVSCAPQGVPARNLGWVFVEGKDRPVQLWEVLEDPAALRAQGMADAAAQVEAMVASSARFDEAQRLWLHDGDWVAAHVLFSALAAECPQEDGVSRVRAAWTARGPGPDAATVCGNGAALQFRKDGAVALVNMHSAKRVALQ